MSTRRDYSRLVLEERVDGRLYTDSKVFADEVAAIWERVWVYVAHTSEVPQPGDWVARRLGLAHVIMACTAAGTVRLYHNRCPRCAAPVCGDDRGATATFVCSVDGSSYPLADGLTPVPSFDTYHGFGFGRLTGDGPNLHDHLGNSRVYLDQLVAHSPAGQLDLAGPAIKSELHGNWKMPAENAVDGYHPFFTHRSVLERALGDSKIVDSTVLSRDLGQGHAAMDYTVANSGTGAGATERRVNIVDVPADLDIARAEHRRLLEEAYGTERAARIWAEGLHNVLIFPNLALIRGDVRTIVPVCASRTFMRQTMAWFVGAPDRVNIERLRWQTAAYGPSGMVGSDDAEIYERTQVGLTGALDSWVVLSRGLHDEAAAPDGTLSSGRTDESAQRAFWRHYVKVMSAPVPT